MKLKLAVGFALVIFALLVVNIISIGLLEPLQATQKNVDVQAINITSETTAPPKKVEPVAPAPKKETTTSTVKKTNTSTTTTTTTSKPKPRTTRAS